MQGNNPPEMTGPGRNKIEIDHGVLKSELPEAPGVYLFKDASGHVIYVGKAKNLKKRVLSYFKSGPDSSPKTALMIGKASGLDYILTATENEAFILESSLIKGHMPKYNIILRDDKQYPCLRLDIKEAYPRLAIVRKIKKDGAIYFGPFSSSHSVKSTLRLIDRVFRLRKCKTGVLSKKARPCLNFQLGRCLGPCAYEVTDNVYRKIVAQVRLLLEGRNNELLKQLIEDMRQLADHENFEEAAEIRDQISAVKRTLERQHVVSSRLEDLDVIGLAYKDNRYQMVVQFVRKGYLTASRNHSFKDTAASPSEVMEAFLKQYYSQSVFLPKHILISEPVEDLDSIIEWISAIAGEKISISRPMRGEKLSMIKMAVSNAEDALIRAEQQPDVDILELARSCLNLNSTPERIECLDISNLQGRMAVGTAASFLNGKPFRAGYRNYKINKVEGINDYAMMSELVARHLLGAQPPDLLVLDGGKGHLLAGNKAIEGLALQKRPEIISIAKADERKGEKADKIYLTGRKNPVVLRCDHPVLLLLMHIRDEAHRRAVSYHRKLRKNEMEKSQLDLIPGIGPGKKRLLLKEFGSIDVLSRARPEDMALVRGISKTLAQNIADFFLQKAEGEGDGFENKD
jgi:excinuclease ABC subunit C